MIACLAIPGFELRAALRSRPSLALQPCRCLRLPRAPSRSSVPSPPRPIKRASGQGCAWGRRSLLSAARARRARPRRPERDWEEIVRRLEDNGFAVESAQLGTAYFDTRGVERLYGGLEQALKRALAAVGSHWDARWCGHPPVRRPCGSQRRAPRPGSRRLRRAHAGLPRSASTPPARARRATPRGAGGAG